MTQDLQQTVQDLLTRAGTGETELEILRGYTLVRKLGEGGMGAVFLLRHTETGDQVAFKVMRPQLVLDPEARKLFQREVANTMALHHQNIVSFRGAGSAGALLFLLMDYCNGGSVAAHIQRVGGKLPLREAMDITLQALDGLAYAHQALVPYVELADGRVGQGTGLVHRDLKPDNLFLVSSDGSQVVKIGDYGLSKAFELAGLSGQTITGKAWGTPQFMPKQQATDYKYVGPAADLWAITACLYNMLTGMFPRDFRGREPWNVVLYTDAIPVRQRDATIPPALAEVIDRALDDHDDELHFQSAAALKQALQEAL